jgi:hypothetical protein
MSDTFGTVIESPSTEIWLEIFDYLDTVSLYRAFYGLISKINGILRRQASVSLKLKQRPD